VGCFRFDCLEKFVPKFSSSWHCSDNDGASTHRSAFLRISVTLHIFWMFSGRAAASDTPSQPFPLPIWKQSDPVEYVRTESYSAWWTDNVLLVQLMWSFECVIYPALDKIVNKGKIQASEVKWNSESSLRGLGCNTTLNDFEWQQLCRSFLFWFVSRYDMHLNKRVCFRFYSWTTGA